VSGDVVQLILGLVQGVLSSTIFVLVLFVGFCVVVGFSKLKRTAGESRVVKSLEEAVSRKAVEYLPPDAPRGPADQLRSPELVQAAARKA